MELSTEDLRNTNGTIGDAGLYEGSLHRKTELARQIGLSSRKQNNTLNTEGPRELDNSKHENRHQCDDRGPTETLG